LRIWRKARRRSPARLRATLKALVIDAWGETHLTHARAASATPRSKASASQQGGRKTHEGRPWQPATVTVISKTGHQLIASHHIDPDHNYWRNQQKNPGRWPGKPVTDESTHV
jgi:ribosomal protein L32